MSIPITFYVRAKSKKALNERLANAIPTGAGRPLVEATHYIPYSEERSNLLTVPHGSVIKIYDKFVGGSPYAKAYGNWDAKKQRVK